MSLRLFNAFLEKEQIQYLSEIAALQNISKAEALRRIVPSRPKTFEELPR